jgi:hypothetical protein
MIFRRATAQLLATTALALALGAASFSPAQAEDKTVTIGADLSMTGADALAAIRVKNAISLAVEGANQGNAVPGYHISLMVLDDGTATAGQYDPAQAATNARKMVAEKSVVGWRRSRCPRPIRTSPIRSSPRSTSRRARRSISARLRRTPTRARTWRTSSPRSWV